MGVPNIISVTMDVPVELIAKDDVNGMKIVYTFSFTHKVVTSNSVIESTDGGEDFYSYLNTYAVLEVSGGLAYFDYGWKIFGESVQEKYASYVADKEILGDK